jgi:hypothetical protein
MVEIKASPRSRVLLLATIILVAAAGVAVGWFASRARDAGISAECQRLYAAARTPVDTPRVDQTLLPEIRVQEDVAGGLACGVLRATGRLTPHRP